MALETPRKKVQVWVRAGAEYLLLKTNPKRGAFWQPVTGSVEAGETIEAAALRELVEETGLAPHVELSSVLSPFEFESNGKLFREYAFLAKVDPSSREKVRIDPKEHTEFKWVSLEQALELVKHESNARILSEIAHSFE